MSLSRFHITAAKTVNYNEIIYIYIYIFQLHEVNLLRFDDGKKLRIYDCRGVGTEETSNNYYEDDLIKAIGGSIKKDYKVLKIWYLKWLSILLKVFHLHFTKNVSYIVCYFRQLR